MPGITIKNWASDDRPREKMLLKGIEALSNAELIAILIGSGTRNVSAVDVAKELLEKNENDLQRLANQSVREIISSGVKGIGEAKAVAIAAALELGIRRDASQKKRKVVIKSSDVADFLQANLRYKSVEEFWVLYLNRANKINHYEPISRGGITGTVADPKVILKNALAHGATNLILCHNHPSGNLKPSRADEELTQKIKIAAQYFDIKVLDHIIVSDEGYYSFADEGLL